MNAFWVGILYGAAYGAIMAGIGYGACYGYTGHRPAVAWVVWLGAALAGLVKGAEEAKKYDA